MGPSCRPGNQGSIAPTMTRPVPLPIAAERPAPIVPLPAANALLNVTIQIVASRVIATSPSPVTAR